MANTVLMDLLGVAIPFVCGGYVTLSPRSVCLVCHFVYGRVLYTPIDELLACSIKMAEDVITFCRLCCWLNGCVRRDVSISVMVVSVHTGGHLFCCVVT